MTPGRKCRIRSDSDCKRRPDPDSPNARDRRYGKRITTPQNLGRGSEPYRRLRVAGSLGWYLARRALAARLVVGGTDPG